MPAFCYLSDCVIRTGHDVKDDPECTKLLAELNSKSSRNWIIEKVEYKNKRLFRKSKSNYNYTLYLDCHGEWQVINLLTPNGGSVFYGDATNSRQNVMNYMMGLVDGLDLARIESADTPVVLIN